MNDEQRRITLANIEGAINQHALSYGKASGDAKLVAVREAALSRSRVQLEDGGEAALQTRLESFIEAWINIAIGFVINFVGNWFILPLVGFHTLTVKDNLIIGGLFTIVSVARQYAIRRWAQQHLRRAKVVAATYLRDLWNKFLAA